ncbi:MAG TPA: phosphatidylglycerol lysyltransferase domain-containing protein [Candidatus Omnitrophota bacterium]|mgnify:CR=1 FL=1|nr:phosphatidylglycerol lysyltransferase domain-containing protein [Candidatus Omnitrophota bacterium]HPN55603.1 phosphatidylglycerol lysyltransferase domain-containing protein [Candidatus Omnitrophota bacterium]
MGTDVGQHKALVQKYLREQPFLLSAYSFVPLFLWQDFFRFYFEIIDGQLCIFAENEIGSFLSLPPLGREISPGAARECFRRMAQRNAGSGVSRIENVDFRQRAAFPDGAAFYLRGYEFLYYKKDIIGLKGNAYKSKRFDYNHFIKIYDAAYLPFCESMADECLKLYDQWQEGRKRKYADDVYRHMLSENRRIHELAMRHAVWLDLVGRVVLVGGEIKAYTFGYWIHDGIFCVLLEVSDLECKGLPVFIFHEFCADEELAGARFINTMDDFEMTELKRAKALFRPVLQLPVYTVTFSEP